MDDLPARHTIAGVDGFLPFGRGSFMMDLVVVAMGFVIPALCYGIREARRGHYRRHRLINGSVAVILLVVLVSDYIGTAYQTVLWPLLGFFLPTDVLGDDHETVDA